MGGRNGADFNLMDDHPESFSAAMLLVRRLHRAVDRRERGVRAAICWVVEVCPEGYRHEFEARDAAGRRIEPDPLEFDMALRACDEWREQLTAVGLEPWHALALFENGRRGDAECLMSLDGVPEIGVVPHDEVIDWAWSISTRVKREILPG